MKRARRPARRRRSARPRREAEELARIARFLTETLDVATVGRRVVESVCGLFEVPAAGLRLREADDLLVLVAAAGEGPYMPIGHRAPTDFGIYRRLQAKATAFSLARYFNRVLGFDPMDLARYAV